MGYRGLLLNDPYKRDRIDGCMLDIFRCLFLFEGRSLRRGQNKPRGKMEYIDFRVFMRIGLKGTFMGYRGLLLNAPYKIEID
jgi:hypothetical protein